MTYVRPDGIIYGFLIIFASEVWETSLKNTNSLIVSGMKNILRFAVACCAAGWLFAGCSDDESPVLAEALKLDPTSLTLRVGESGRITATVTPSGAEDAQVFWSSDNETIATVDAGVVTAVSVGSARITARAGGVSAVCPVTVNPMESVTVTLNKKTLALGVGDTERLIATVLPEDAADKTVVWSSSDERVATVVDGLVTAIASGKARITAKAGQSEDHCEVTVDPVAVQSVALNKETLGLKVGQTEQLTATVLPQNAADKTVVWSSSDQAIATVVDGLVTAVAPGKARITAKAGQAEDHCEVTVDPIAVETITLDSTSLDMTEGDTEQLTATVLPEDATDKTVTWSSSDDAVATVENGLVTAVGIGTATITASAGDVTASCAVTVAAAGKRWAIGDFYDVDGVQGVVFWVSQDAKSGKIVSLDESVKLWATGPYEARAYDEENGADNTQKIKDLGLPMSSFPACQWCIEHGTGWYMPAIGELQAFLLVKWQIDPVLKANGGKEISQYDWYWSSTEGEESEGSSAICGYITSGGVGSYGEWKDEPEDDTYVRAVYTF